MTEAFLHYLWKMKLLNVHDLHCVAGEKIQILSAGELNPNAGPDFLNARIKIDDTDWAGNVEIHIRSSDWMRHLHDRDAGYNNVILHVVYEYDKEILDNHKQPIPCLEMKNSYDHSMYDRYGKLMMSSDWIPCEAHFKNVSPFVKKAWLHRLLVERLENKTGPIFEALEQNQNNWQEVFYQQLAAAFGTKVNAHPFWLLARSIPEKILAHHKNNLKSIEALLFGTAGLLEAKFNEAYPNELKKEFSFLKKKYNLKPLKAEVWKFLRLRPPNFPTVRLAQFAMLIHCSSHLFSRLIEIKDVNELRALFDVQASEYWNNHYRFGKSSSQSKKKIGKQVIDLLLLNTVAPIFCAYGKYRDEQVYVERAIRLLESLPPEKNAVIQGWKNIGWNAEDSFESQALLQLKNLYCNKFLCLECAIGQQILKPKKD